MSALFRLQSGVLLLILGRSLFWLFAAATGFLTGAAIAARFFQREPEWIVLAIALAVGIVGALLALILPKAIGALAGFWAGGYLVL